MQYIFVNAISVYHSFVFTISICQFILQTIENNSHLQNAIEVTLLNAD